MWAYTVPTVIPSSRPTSFGVFPSASNRTTCSCRRVMAPVKPYRLISRRASSGVIVSVRHDQDDGKEHDRRGQPDQDPREELKAHGRPFIPPADKLSFVVTRTERPVFACEFPELIVPADHFVIRQRSQFSQGQITLKLLYPARFRPFLAAVFDFLRRRRGLHASPPSHPTPRYRDPRRLYEGSLLMTGGCSRSGATEGLRSASCQYP